jgi:hypothetical protein
MMKNLNEFQISFLLILILVILLFFLIVYIFKLKKVKLGPIKKLKLEEIFEKIDLAGYHYDPYQDIFYTKIDAWQREMGYFRLYDEAAAPLNMIIDCEPIYINYGGKRWLIEFWKGQYGMCTGCEIGVYSTEGPDLNIPGVFNGTFYYCVDDEDLLEMSYTLYKKDKVLFRYHDIHWWLTGFSLGEFSEPSDLVMNLKINLKDKTMKDAFVEGLINTGYKDNEDIIVRGNTVSVIFHKPKTRQPFTRKPETDRLIQRKNKFLCDTYLELTKDYDSFPEKIMVIQEISPEIFYNILNIGKTKELFSNFNKIKNYL